MTDRREMRKKIFLETMDYIEKNKNIYKFNSHMIVGNTDSVPIKTDKIHKTTIEIYDMDTLDCSIKTHNENLFTKIGFLVMASEVSRGGGVKTGALAQEEDIARRSDLYNALTKIPYPLKQYETIVIRNCKIVRKNEIDDYDFLKEPYSMTALLSPAFRNPVLKSEEFVIKYKEAMKKKIRILLNSAILEGIEIIILGAWGCGAFNNPPELVAECFKEEIIENYNTQFKKIIFAILDNKKHESNCMIFKKIFKPLMIKEEVKIEFPLISSKILSKEIKIKEKEEKEDKFPSLSSLFS
jgi:uncharacterized protein (TIGR02452 family)